MVEKSLIEIATEQLNDKADLEQFRGLPRDRYTMLLIERYLNNLLDEHYIFGSAYYRVKINNISMDLANVTLDFVPKDVYNDNSHVVNDNGVVVKIDEDSLVGWDEF